MVPVVRLITPDEIPAWCRSVSVPFLAPATTDELLARWQAHWRPVLEPDRTWAVEDRGRLVGNANVFSRTVTLPAGPGRSCPAVPVAAVSGVGVHPTHRRRGLLRRLVGAMLDDARARGECLAALTASEGAIYGRFGFGPATQAASYQVETHRAAFAGGAPIPAAGIDLLDAEEAAKVVPGLFAAATAGQAGHISRTDPVWAEVFEDRPDDRGGASARWYAVAGDGYALWRTEEVTEGHDSFGRAHLREIVAASAATEAALWRFVLDLDLVREVVAHPRPVDEPLRHRLADPRALRTTGVGDWLWFRILDTPVALTARGYLTEGRLVLDVRPPAATPTGADGADGPDPAAGRWTLDAGPDGATCRPATAAEATDLALGVAELGMVLAGGVRASVLADAGRVGEARPGALDVADRLFASRPAPLCVTAF